jgi:hypothetical protein
MREARGRGLRVTQRDLPDAGSTRARGRGQSVRVCRKQPDQFQRSVRAPSCGRYSSSRSCGSCRRSASPPAARTGQQDQRCGNLGGDWGLCGGRDRRIRPSRRSGVIHAARGWSSSCLRSSTDFSFIWRRSGPHCGSYFDFGRCATSAAGDYRAKRSSGRREQPNASGLWDGRGSANEFDLPAICQPFPPGTGSVCRAWCSEFPNPCDQWWINPISCQRPMMSPDSQSPIGPGPFAYFVCPSSEAGSTELDRTQGVYLRGRAEARYLQPLLEPLFDQLGFGLSPTSDTVVSGAWQLDALQAVLTRAVEEVERQDERWPVLMGYSMDHENLEIGAPVFETASRTLLLNFLRAVLKIVNLSKAGGGGVHFGGGE